MLTSLVVTVHVVQNNVFVSCSRLKKRYLNCAGCVLYSVQKIAKCQLPSQPQESSVGRICLAFEEIQEMIEKGGVIKLLSIHI